MKVKKINRNNNKKNNNNSKNGEKSQENIGVKRKNNGLSPNLLFLILQLSRSAPGFCCDLI